MKRVLPPADDTFQHLRADLKNVSASPAAAHLSSRSTGTVRSRGSLTPLPHLTSNNSNADVSWNVRATSPSRSRVNLSSQTPPPQYVSSSALPTTTGARSGPLQHHANNRGGMLAMSASSSAPLPIFMDEDDVPLESQKQTLMTWMNHYARELADADSSMIATEVLLQQIADGVAASSSSYDPAKPHGLRVAAMCAVAENVCDLVGRYRVVLRPVLDELYRSIYLQNHHNVAAPREEMLTSRMASLGLRTKESIYLQKFLARKPYFEEVEEKRMAVQALKCQIVALSSSKTAGRLVLDRLSNNWRSQVTRMVFRSWRGAALKARTHNSIFSKFLSSLQRKDILQTHFYAWRLEAKHQQLSRAREDYAIGMEQLATQEATTHARWLELDDQLEETRMVVTRLKVEKDLQKLQREQLQQIVESSLGQAEGWRRVTTDVISFLGTLKRYMATSKPMIGNAQHQSIADTAMQVLFVWAGKIVGPLPLASKVKMTNFGPDMKDGLLLLLIMHVMTNGEINLKVVQDSPHDVQGRLQIVLDALKAMGIQLPLTINDVFPTSPEMNFYLLYVMWYHFETPPVPGADTALGLTGGFRDDLDATAKYIEMAKTFYPAWLERRNIMQQYANFVLLAKLKNLPSPILSEFEAIEAEKEQEAFAIHNTVCIPSAFLTAVNLSPSQKFQNDEERQRVNTVVIAKHIGAIRYLFERYSTRRSPLADSITAARDAAKSKQASSKRKASSTLAASGSQSFHSPSTSTVHPSEFHESRDVLVEMDVMGFYRMCCDAGICKVGVAPVVAKGNQGAAAKGGKRAGGSSNKDVNQILSEPRSFTKVVVFDMLSDIVSKFPSVSMDDPCISPTVFVALLLHFAVNRYANPVASSSLQPAPAAAALELLLSNDFIPILGVKPAASFSFPTVLLQESVRTQVFESRRAVLKLAFEKHCSISTAEGTGGGFTRTMAFQDFNEFLRLTLPSELFSRLKDDLQSTFEQSALCFLEPLIHTSSNSQMQPLVLPSSKLLDVPKGSPILGAQPPQMPPSSPIGGGQNQPLASFSPPASPNLSMAASPVFSSKASPHYYVVGASEPADLRIVYGEFEIAVSALACLLYPSPFIALPDKIQSLINEMLASDVIQSLLTQLR